MLENQSVCQWGLRPRATSDPAVYKNVVGADPVDWYLEQKKFSSFLAVMLHYNAVSGGMPYLGSGGASEHSFDELNAGWTFIGEVNQMWAYARPNQVVCITTSSLPFLPPMLILAGAKTKGDIRAIADSLGVSLK